MSFIENVWDIFSINNEPVNVLMFGGGSGVGKTTTMTAIYNEFQNKSSGEHLKLFAEDTTSNRLQEKLEMLKGQIAEDTVEVKANGIESTSQDVIYEFFMAENRKSNSKIKIKIKDTVGGDVKNKKKEMREKLDESQVIIVAVDSPALMEVDYKNRNFNEQINKPSRIRDYLNELNNDNTPKLIVFTLLKSEKYFNENTLDQLENRFKEEYEPVLRLLKEKEDISIAYIPIKTLGAVYFSEIKYEDEHEKDPIFVYKRKFKENYNPSEAEKVLCLLLKFVLTTEYDKTYKINFVKREKIKKTYNKYKEFCKNVHFLQNEKLTEIN